MGRVPARGLTSLSAPLRTRNPPRRAPSPHTFRCKRPRASPTALCVGTVLSHIDSATHTIPVGARPAIPHALDTVPGLRRAPYDGAPTRGALRACGPLSGLPSRPACMDGNERRSRPSLLRRHTRYSAPSRARVLARRTCSPAWRGPRAHTSSHAPRVRPAPDGESPPRITRRRNARSRIVLAPNRASRFGAEHVGARMRRPRRMANPPGGIRGGTRARAARKR